MTMPARMLASALDAVNPEARYDRTADCVALYEGGDAFEKRKDKLIIKRKIEEGGLTGAPFSGSAHYHHRKKRAQYINRVGGLLDWIISSVTKDTPHVAIRNLDEASEEAIEFWTSFNEDADGEGQSFPNFVRSLMKDELSCGRFAAEIHSDEDDPEYLRVERVDPLNVLDWGGEPGEEWAKVRYSSAHRTGGEYAPVDAEKIEWVFYRPEAKYTYVGYRKGAVWVNAAGETIGSDPELALESEILNPGGIIPFHNFLLPKSWWLLDRVFDVATALYNAELDLSFALAQAAYPQPVLTLESGNRVDELVQSEMAVFMMRIGEKFEYVSPGFTAFDSLFKNVERLKTAFTESVQMASQDASSIPQVGRMSATALKTLREPTSAMVTMYSWAVLWVLEKLIKEIQTFRGEEDLDIFVEGFGEVILTPELELWLKENGDEDGRYGSGERDEDGEDGEDGSGEEVSGPTGLQNVDALRERDGT